MFSDEEIVDVYRSELEPAQTATLFEQVFNGHFSSRHLSEFSVIRRKGTPIGLASPLVSAEKKTEIRRLGGIAVHAQGKGQRGLTPEVRARALAKAAETNRAKGKARAIATATARVARCRQRLKKALMDLASATSVAAVDPSATDPGTLTTREKSS